MKKLIIAFIFTAFLPNVYAETVMEELATANKLFEKVDGKPHEWSEFLTDDAAGSVSAAGMLGIKGESVKPVENIRDIVTAFEGFRTEDGQGTLAIAVTPGRTDLARVSLASYYNDTVGFKRLWANTTIGYAQGEQKIGEVDFERYAISAEATWIPNDKDDLILVYTKDALASGECGQKIDKIVDEHISKRNKEVEDKRASLLLEKANAGKPGSRSTAEIDADLEKYPDQKIELEKGELAKSIEAGLETCLSAAKDKIRWNRSKISLMFGTGRIKPKDEPGDEHSLGQTVVLTGTKRIGSSAAFSILYRHTANDPDPQTLLNESVDEKDQSLVMGRLTVGGEKIRVSLEVSDTEQKDQTLSQQVFKQALGLDFRVYKDTWLSLRFGRQRNESDTDDEVASLLSISYSPTALLALK